MKDHERARAAYRINRCLFFFISTIQFHESWTISASFSANWRIFRGATRIGDTLFFWAFRRPNRLSNSRSNNCQEKSVCPTTRRVDEQSMAGQVFAVFGTVASHYCPHPITMMSHNQDPHNHPAHSTERWMGLLTRNISIFNSRRYRVHEFLLTGNYLLFVL